MSNLTRHSITPHMDPELFTHTQEHIAALTWTNQVCLGPLGCALLVLATACLSCLVSEGKTPHHAR